MKNYCKLQWVELWLRSSSIIQAQISYMNPALEVWYFDLNISRLRAQKSHEDKGIDSWLYLLPENLNECVQNNAIFIYIKQIKWNAQINTFWISNVPNYIYTFDYSVTPSLLNVSHFIWAKSMNWNFPEGLTCPYHDWPTQCTTNNHEYEYSYCGKPF